MPLKSTALRWFIVLIALLIAFLLWTPDRDRAVLEARYPGIEFSQFSGAEMLARKYDLQREQLVEYALGSHRRAIEATRVGRFEEEVLPVRVRRAEGGDVDRLGVADAGCTRAPLGDLEPQAWGRGIGRRLLDRATFALLGRGYREAVLGSFAARKLGFKVGSEFKPYHGLNYDANSQHEETYVVTGVLEPSNTPADKVIWIPIAGLQNMAHDHVINIRC